MSTDTVIDYIGYLKESWLLFSVENIEAKLAERSSNKKYYFIDNGILNLFLTDPHTSLLENLTAIQLRRLYGDEVYYYHNGVEVDFFVPEEHLAIQVSYSIQDVETRKREVNALLQFSKRMMVNRMVIITKEEETTISENGLNIDVIPIWKWLITQSLINIKVFPKIDKLQSHEVEETAAY